MKTTAGAAAFLAFGRRGYSWSQSPLGITKWAVTLPGLGPGQANNIGNYITVLSPDTKTFKGTDYYEIVAREFSQKLHPALPATKFWGYAADDDGPGKDNFDSKYLGGVIVATSGRPVKLKVRNLLPPSHILPVDSTTVDPTMAAEVGGRTDRMAIHLHGGFVHWDSDGGPFSWFSNPKNHGGFVHGSSFMNGVPRERGSAIYDYPNDHPSLLQWYHDHAYGITRLNAYAGLAAGYLITDSAEAGLISAGILPDLPGFPLGVPLVIQDKTFFDPALDPSYPVGGAKKGSLWYPHVYQGPELPDMTLPPVCGSGTGRWDIGTGTPPAVSCIPEFFGDINLVNGAPYPTLPVAPRRYRFRVLNGANARFYNLQLYVADDSVNGITLKPSTTEVDSEGNPLVIPTNAPGPKMIQIGTESGFLKAPVVLNDPPKPMGFFTSTDPDDPRNGNANRYNLLMSPAERADLIVDFRGFEGQTVVLYSDTPAPFPGGDIRNDYYPGAYDLSCIGGATTPVPGSGPDTRIVMRFVVGTTGGVSELDFNHTLEALRTALPIAFAATHKLPSLEHAAEKVKTLNEDFDSYGRLIQTLGAPEVTPYLATPTEVAHKGEVQIWQIYNLTGDTHPIHFHLVDVQVLKREAWAYNRKGEPRLPLRPIHGSERPPDPNENGEKETVRMNPGEITTVAMKFDLPKTPLPDPSPRLRASYGIKGYEYVWHCHILEHEEHDMMHALFITA